MPDFTVEADGCIVEVREQGGNHYVQWVKNEGTAFAYVKALKKTVKEASRLGVQKLHFFIDPTDLDLMLVYARAGAKTEAVVMTYEVKG